MTKAAYIRARWTGRRWSYRRGVTGWLTFALLALLVVPVLVAVPVRAAFVATTANSSTFTSAASFPTYPASVIADSAWSYHRGQESPSAAATLAAADTSGNARPGTYNGITNGPATFWKFDENAGSSTADSSGAANPGTSTGSPTWTTGKVGSAISLDGSTQHVSGTRAAVDTSRAFTVAAWVYLTDDSMGRVAVSQSGSIASGFMLRYNQWDDAWQFVATDSNSFAPAFDSSVSGLGSASVNTWTHLVGVYDGAANIRLYVNGVPQAAGAHASAWDATGALQVGRVREWGSWQGASNGWAPWHGRVDEVRAFQRALTASEITSLGNGLPVTAWQFSEAVGSSTADRGTGATNGSLDGSTGWTTSGHDGNSLSFDGNPAVVFTNSPGAATNASYSVSAWVYLAAKGGSRTVACQNGTNICAYWLQYDPGADRWSFVASDADSTGASFVRAYGTASPNLNTWYQLTGVYDSGAGTIKLYVDGVLQNTTAFASPWNATSTFGVGRGYWGGSGGDYWDGRIDTVKVHQRALGDSEAADLYNGVDYTETDMTAGLTGALQGAQQGQQSTTAVAYAGMANGYNGASQNNPTTFTLECWFRSVSSTGGLLIGFGDTSTGASTNHDRLVYLDSGGKLTFGTYTSTYETIRSTATYNDGSWHYVAASLGAAGQKLYVDGSLVDSDSAITGAQNFTGYWRWAGDDLTGWPNAPTTFFTGTLDEVAVYSSQLTDKQIARHYAADH